MPKTVEELVAESKAAIKEITEKALKDTISKEEFDAFVATTKETLDKVTVSDKQRTELTEEFAKLKEVAIEQGATIKALKESTVNMNDKQKKAFSQLSKAQQVQFLVDKGLDTQEFKDWQKTNMKGAMTEITAKTVTGLAADHTGEIFVSEMVDNVVDINRAQPHMIDNLTVSQTDETSIVYPEITDLDDVYTLGAKMLTENEEITDVSFKSKENTSKVVRLGVSMEISRRYFRGKSSGIVNRIVSIIPDALGFKKDVQILHGDGEGSNLSGFLKDARELNLDGKAFAAGKIASVATYNGGKQTLVTFTEAHEMLSGDKVTFALATATGYNVEHKDCILIDETKIVINFAYVVEADTSAWTAQTRAYQYKDVDVPNEIDVLNAAVSRLNAGLYNADVIYMHPSTRAKFKTLKGTDGHYISNSELEERLGVKIVLMQAIPAGWYLTGDFSAKAVEVREYSPLSIQFLDDITTKRANSLVVLAQEEFHLVKYNPKWYIYDRLEVGKGQLDNA